MLRVDMKPGRYLFFGQQLHANLHEIIRRRHGRPFEIYTAL
jgi:hypothetical protein